MPAPNDDILNNFEENIEKAALAAIEAAGIDGLRARQHDELPAFSVRTEFTLGAATGTMTIRPGTANPPRKEYSEYVGILEIQIEANSPTVSPSAIEGIDTKFGEVRAKVRTLFQEGRWALNDTNLPYYRVSVLRPAGASNGVTPDTEADIGILRWDVKFCIKPSAWPVLG